MKNLFLALLAGSGVFVQQASAQTEVIKKNGYSLSFTNNDPALDPATKQKLINTFFETYPKMAKTYNKDAIKTVSLAIDTAYKGVAATGNARIVISSKWTHSHPEDVDVVTHEGMHVVQDYKESVGPLWLTEGIADYVRYQFGVNNEAAKWSLPDFKAGQNYTNSYRITARFLLWIEKKYKKGFVKEADQQLRAHTFNQTIWQQQTGKTLDELWKEYSENPALPS